MKRLLLAFGLLAALASPTWAQCNGKFSAGNYCGSVSGGAPGPVPAASIIGTLPLPSADIFVGNASNKAAAVAPTGSGDCTFTFTNLGVFGYTCTKTNGVAFGSLATQSSVTSAQLPSPFTNGTRQGNTSAFVTFTGSAPTTNHSATFDANGNIQDGGASTGTVTNVAGGGLAVASPTNIVNTGSITVTAAVKSDQTTATSNTVAVTPVIQQFHPSAMKVFGYATLSGTTLTDHSPYGGVFTRTGTGSFTFTFTTSFTSANYSCVPGVQVTGGTVFTANILTQGISTVTMATNQAIGFSLTDPIGVSIQCGGTQ